ncbi:MAG: cell division protein [bacterium]|nr:MAG: cell division protein [bacterium]
MPGIFPAVLFCLWYAALPAADVELRIVLEKAAQFAAFSAEEELEITEAGSGVPLNTGSVNDVRVEIHRQGLRINLPVFPVESVRIQSPGGVISFNGKKYRGYLVLSDTGKGAFEVINHVEMEDYLKSVVASEMPSEWPMEALKAQAVAARTYGLYRRAQNSEMDYDMEAGVNDQVYGGVEAEDERSSSAVLATSGVVLTYENALARTYYHSTSGGRTENGVDVFGGAGLPYLKSVYCGYDRQSPYFVWQYSVSFSDIRTSLSRGGFRTGAISGISLRSRSSSGRVAELNIHTRRGRNIIKAADFRKMIGYKKIKSTYFSLRRRGNRITFKGRGYGHGVGLCQWGAKGMAEKNFNYESILQYYYPGAGLSSGLLNKGE